MEKKLELIEKKFNELNEQLSDPSIAADPNRFMILNKERTSLEETVAVYADYKKINAEIEETKELMKHEEDPEMLDYLNQELDILNGKHEKIKEKLFILLLPKDPYDEKDIIMEIRGGAGGDEAALFAGELFRMYCKYAERKGWKTDITGIKNYADLRLFDFIYMAITGWATVCMLCLYQPFISVWVGPQMMLDNPAVIGLCSYFYVLKAGDIRWVYHEGAGLWRLRGAAVSADDGGADLPAATLWRSYS